MFAGQSVKISRFYPDAQFIRLRKKGMRQDLQNLASKKLVIDASAFYSGVSFLTVSTCYTTNLILSEIKHLNRRYGAIEFLIDSDKLKILEPSKEFLRKVVTIAKKTGDYQRLSTADLSVLALALQLNSILISDDYAVQNMPPF